MDACCDAFFLITNFDKRLFSIIYKHSNEVAGGLQGCGTRKMQSPEGVNCNMLKWRLNCKQNSTFVPII
jgi:hypothetical protein